MSKIELSKDDAAFLKDLQHELLTQTNDGNAQPAAHLRHDRLPQLRT